LNRIEQGIADLYNGTPWAAPTLANSWVSYGASDTPGYRVVANWLELRGAIKNGTLVSAQLVMTFPGLQVAQRFLGVVFDGKAGGAAPAIAGSFIVQNSGADLTIIQNFAWATSQQILLGGIRIPLT
jgi:hypothetical protein